MARLAVVTANLNGIRSAHAKGFFVWMARTRADIVCVQEIKAQAADLPEAARAPQGYHAYFHFAARKGYSGVGIYSRERPDGIVEGLGVADIDAEGRYLEARFGRLSVVSLYLPSGSASEASQQAKFAFMARFLPHLAALRESGQEVLLCGDWNIAHREIDLANWRANQKNSGFLPEERAWLSKVLDDLGYVDVYRHLYPEARGEGYTWWSNRGQAWAKNVGWRIDYHIATPGMAARARRAEVYKLERFSDHAPLTVEYAAP